MTFTTKDVRKISKDWYTLTVVSFGDRLESQYLPNPTGEVKQEMHFDLSRSKWDKRDWILSKRNGLELQQDAGFIDAFASRYTTLTEMKERLVDTANKEAPCNENLHNH